MESSGFGARQCARGKSPRPVPRGNSRAIHASSRRKFQQILHLADGPHRRRGEGEASHALCRAVHGTGIGREPISFLLAQMSKPACGRLVVVGARIDDGLDRMVVGQIATGRGAECPLENPHAGESEIVPKSIDGRGLDPQVLRDDRQSAESLLEDLEKFPTWRRSPSPVSGGSFSGRNMPESDEPKEVIESNGVESLKCLTESRCPPFPVLIPMSRPPVVGMSPELPITTEVVGRSAGQ